MVYSDTTNLSGIIQEEERLTNLGYALISGVAQTLKEFTSLNNIACHKIWHTIFTSNGNWQYDDANKTDLPSGVANLVSGTATYAMPSDALTIKRIEIKDASGIWFKLMPITLEEIESKGEFMKDAGIPEYYRLVGSTIELFPTPNYASTGGLKVFFDRDSVDFATTDTTKTPGFASPYHELVPVKASLAWFTAKEPTSAVIPLLLQEEARLEKGLKEFYGMRFKDKKAVVGRAYSTYK